MTAPANGATPTEDTPVTLSCSISRSGAACVFYVNGVSVGAGTVVGTSASRSHTFTDPGSYTIFARVTEGSDTADSPSITINVQAESVTPTVAFTTIANGDLVHCNIANVIGGTCTPGLFSSVEVFWKKPAGSPVSLGVDNSVSDGSFNVTKTFVDTFGASDATRGVEFTAVGTLIAGGTVSATLVTADVYSPVLAAVADGAYTGLKAYFDHIHPGADLTLDGSNLMTSVRNKISGIGTSNFGGGNPQWSATAFGTGRPGVVASGQRWGEATADTGAFNAFDGATPRARMFIHHKLALQDPASGQIMVGFGTNSTSANRTIFQVLATGAGLYAISRVNQGNTASGVWDPMATRDTDQHLYEARFPGDASGTVYQRLDGEPEFSETISADWTMDSGRYAIGGSQASAGSFFLGSLGIIAWGDVSDAQASEIREYISAVTGVPTADLAALASFSQITANALAYEPVNGSAARQWPATSDATHQYVAYIDNNDVACVAKRAHGSNTWQHVATPFNELATIGNGDGLGASDNHNHVSIQIDGSGYVELIGGMHNHQMRRTVTTTPRDITTFPRPLGDLPASPDTPWAPLIAGHNSHESSVSYPQLGRFHSGPGAGDLLMMYRQGSSGAGNTYVIRKNHATQTWVAIANPLIDVASSGRNAYPTTFVIDSQGRMHVAWCWRDGAFPLAGEYDICYAMSAPNPGAGASWHRTPAGASAYTLPITEPTAERVATIPLDSGLLTCGGLCVDGSDRPALVLSQCFNPTVTNPASAPHETEYFVVYWTGSAWTSKRRIPGLPDTNFHNNNTTTGGRLLTPADIVYEAATDRFHVIASPWAGGLKGLWRTWISRADLAAGTGSWSPWIQICQQDVGHISPRHDEDRWRATGELWIYVQSVSWTYRPGQVAGLIRVDLAA